MCLPARGIVEPIPGIRRPGIEQRRHFVEQRERQESGVEETPHEHDEEFVRALNTGC